MKQLTPDRAGEIRWVAPRARAGRGLKLKRSVSCAFLVSSPRARARGAD